MSAEERATYFGTHVCLEARQVADDAAGDGAERGQQAGAEGDAEDPVDQADAARSEVRDRYEARYGKMSAAPG
jgi:hypothetical protein